MKTNVVARLSLVVLLSCGLWVAYAYGQAFGTEAAKVTTVKIKDDLFVIHNDFVPGNTPPSAVVSSAATERTMPPTRGSLASVTRLVMPDTEIAASGSLQSL